MAKKRLDKRQRALVKVRLARIARADDMGLVPQSMCRSAWAKNGIPINRPSRQWGFDANLSRSTRMKQNKLALDRNKG